MEQADKVPVSQLQRPSALERPTPQGVTSSLLDNRPEAMALHELAQAFAQSPRVVAQRVLSTRLHGSQRMVAQAKEIRSPRGQATQPEAAVGAGELAPGQFTSEQPQSVAEAQGRTSPMAEGAASGAQALPHFGAEPSQPIQRLTFRIERGDDETLKAAKLAHIAAQRELLLSYVTLYFDSGGTQASPTQADGLEPGTRDNTALVPPSDSKLAEAFYARYLTSYKVYTVSFITQPDVDPQQMDPTLGARARVVPPFPVIRSGNRGEGGDIGRTLAADWAWDVNRAYRGTALTANLGGRFHPLRLSPEMLAHNGGLPPARWFGNWRGGTLRRLNAPASQPFVFFVPEEVDDRTHRHHDREELTNEEFATRFASQMDEGEGFRQQEQRSLPHDTARQGSGRDPGTAMGGAASALMEGGWAANPQHGALGSHEWCHLVGDGDGGNCDGQNLVIGTNQVNTEQLAMENGLRIFRGAFQRRGLGIYIDAKVVGEEVDSPDPGVGKVLRADWISYAISIRSLHDGGASINLSVHSQVMDAGRGTITRGEFDTLRATVQTKIRAVQRGLAAAQTSEPHFAGATWPSDPRAQQHPHVLHNAEFLTGSPQMADRLGTGMGVGVVASPHTPLSLGLKRASASSSGSRMAPAKRSSSSQASELMPPPGPEATVAMLLACVRRGELDVIPTLLQWLKRCREQAFVDGVMQELSTYQ